MMAAIREAAAESALFRGSSLSDGLRCIRTFERVNGIPFDPFDDYHRSLIEGMGAHERIFRRAGFTGRRRASGKARGPKRAARQQIQL
jgi:hypothetical protein